MFLSDRRAWGIPFVGGVELEGLRSSMPLALINEYYLPATKPAPRVRAMLSANTGLPLPAQKLITLRQHRHRFAAPRNSPGCGEE
jgi:hypothetical protein